MAPGEKSRQIENTRLHGRELENISDESFSALENEGRFGSHASFGSHFDSNDFANSCLLLKM